MFIITEYAALTNDVLKADDLKLNTKQCHF